MFNIIQMQRIKRANFLFSVVSQTPLFLTLYVVSEDHLQYAY